MTTIKSNKDGKAVDRAEELRLQIFSNHDLLLNSRPMARRLNTAVRGDIYEAHLSYHKTLDMQGILHKLFTEKPALYSYYSTYEFRKQTKSIEIYYNELYLILSKMADEQDGIRRPYYRTREEALSIPMDQRLLSDVMRLGSEDKHKSLAKLFVQPPYQLPVEEYNKRIKLMTGRPAAVLKDEDARARGAADTPRKRKTATAPVIKKEPKEEATIKQEPVAEPADDEGSHEGDKTPDSGSGEDGSEEDGSEEDGSEEDGSGGDGSETSDKVEDSEDAAEDDDGEGADSEGE